MRLRDVLFPAKKALPPARDSQEQVERWVVDSFRSLGKLCVELADWVEAQRLARGGYKPQDRFLERTDLNSSGAERKGPPSG